MIQYLFVKFLEAGSQFLILLPNLIFCQLAVVSEFSHMLITLRVTELWVGDCGQG
jgi:hypothetical protein